MGENHARVYDDLVSAELVGVHDVQEDRAEAVAGTYGVPACSFSELLTTADVVSVAVPTEHHYRTVRECIDAGTHVLVEKPFVSDPGRGRKLVEFADQRGVTLQVGHIERFNPAVQELFGLLSDREIVAIDAQRLGPPLDRSIDNSAVMDLMIHDIDVLLQLVDAPAEVTAAATRDGEYATATIQAETGEIGRLTSSRVTEEKVRKLTVTTSDCRIKVDYTDQSLEICRQSFPEHVNQDRNVHYRHENVVEKVMVEYREPLKAELEAFLESVRNGEEPSVTGEDGIRAVEIARSIENSTTAPSSAASEPVRSFPR